MHTLNILFTPVTLYILRFPYFPYHSDNSPGVVLCREGREGPGGPGQEGRECQVDAGDR